MPSVQPRFKGTPTATGHRLWACKFGTEGCTEHEPCAQCRGSRNRKSGLKRQNDARKALQVVTGKHVARFASLASNEESWRLPLRVEVKSGQMDAGPVWTKYAKAEAQSDAARARGDNRPFAAVHMGTKTSDGLFTCRLSKLGEVVQALLEMT